MLPPKEQLKNAIKWIEALLSGEYKQARGFLGSENSGFCCWGLGCHIVDLSYHPKQMWNNSFNEYVGFRNNEGRVYKDNTAYSYVVLSDLNDNENWTFEQIGKLLIKHSNPTFNNFVAAGITKHFQHINLDENSTTSTTD